MAIAMVLVDTSTGAGASTGGPHIGVRAGERATEAGACMGHCAVSMVRGGRAVRERCASMDAATKATGVRCVSAARLGTLQRRVVRERCASRDAATVCGA